MQVMSNGRVRRTAGEWREIISRFEKSGQSAQEFCRSEQLNQASFVHWRRKLAGSSGSSQFIPVTANSAEPSSWTLTITLPNGCQLRLED